MKVFDTYLPKVNPLLLGFCISLLGSLPLGYINMVGLQILLQQRVSNHIFFAIGIISVQFFVLKLVSLCANWLLKQRRLLLLIDVFTIFFFAFLTYHFFSNSNNQSYSLAQFPFSSYPFLLGLFLNSLNFIQWPYWAGIFIYLFRTEKLQQHKKSNYLFITGALLGTFIGMMTFAHTSHFFIVKNDFKINNYFNSIFALLFFILTITQSLFMIKKINNHYPSTS